MTGENDTLVAITIVQRLDAQPRAIARVDVLSQLGAVAWIFDLSLVQRLLQNTIYAISRVSPRPVRSAVA